MVRLVRLQIKLFLFIFFSSLCRFAQVPSQKQQLRVQIWAEKDSFPRGLDEVENTSDQDAQGKHELPKVSSS